MRMTISKRILIAIFSILFFACIMGGYSFLSINKAAIVSDDIENVLVQASSYSTELSANVLQMRRIVSLFLVAPSESAYKEINRMFEVISSSMEKLHSHVMDPDHAEIMPEAAKIMPELDKLVKEYLSVAKHCTDILFRNQSGEKTFYESNDKMVKDTAALLKSVTESIKKFSDAGNTDKAFALFVNFGILNDMKALSLDIKYNFSVGANTNDIKVLNQVEPMLKSLLQYENYIREHATLSTSAAFIRNMDVNVKKMEESFSQVSAGYAEMESVNNNLTNVASKLQILNDKASEIVKNIVIVGSAQSASNLRALSKVVLVLLIIMICVGFIGVFVLRATVIKPLNRFVALVGDLTSGDGDLTKRIPTTTKDELADLAMNFNKFIQNVQEIVVEVKHAADEVASGNNQLASTMEELSSTFMSQSEQVSGIVLDMDNIKESSKDSVDGLSACMNLMNGASEETDKGANKLVDVRESITHISNKAESLSGTIKRLSDSSSQIGEILTAINDIADQTNLLALNAAIEAARAGDAGRGFAVVADEVRKLAERTQKATSEIENIIGALQRESELASNEMTDAGTAVSSGVKVIDETSQSFEHVVDGVFKARENTNIVMGAVSQQYNIVVAVGDKTQVIASGVEESNAAVSEVSATVSHLQEMAEKLKHLVGQFKS